MTAVDRCGNVGAHPKATQNALLGGLLWFQFNDTKGSLFAHCHPSFFFFYDINFLDNRPWWLSGLERASNSSRRSLKASVRILLEVIYELIC